jgi:hypothetical protein
MGDGLFIRGYRHGRPLQKGVCGNLASQSRCARLVVATFLQQLDFVRRRSGQSREESWREQNMAGPAAHATATDGGDGYSGILEELEQRAAGSNVDRMFAGLIDDFQG